MPEKEFEIKKKEDEMKNSYKHTGNMYSCHILFTLNNNNKKKGRGARGTKEESVSVRSRISLSGTFMCGKNAQVSKK